MRVVCWIEIPPNEQNTKLTSLWLLFIKGSLVLRIIMHGGSFSKFAYLLVYIKVPGSYLDLRVTSMTNALHPFCSKCGWRMGGLDSWNGRACKCGHSAPPMDVNHPVDVVKDVAAHVYPNNDLDEASFAEAKLALDATIEGLDPLGGPLQPEVYYEPKGKNPSGN